MKAKLFSLLALLVIISHVYAQNPATTPATTPAAKPPAAMASKTMSSTSAGSLISQLASNLQPSAFSDNWAKVKDGWMKNLSTLKPTDVTGAAMSITTLANNLKPASFTPEFTKMKDDFMTKAKSAKTMADVSGLLKSLSSGINPSAYSADWAKNKTAWMQGLNSLSAMK